MVCGAEYQEGGPGLYSECACGTFAIGRCAECGEPVCGTHSAMAGAVRLCDADLAAQRAVQDRVRVAKQRRREAERETAWFEWEKFAVNALAHAHPIQRIIWFLRVVTIDELERTLSRAGPRTPGLGDALRGLLPDLWTADLVSAPPWDHDEVHAWLSATTPPTTTNFLYLNNRHLVARVLWDKLDPRRRASAQGWAVNSEPTKALGGTRSIVAFTDGRRGIVDQHGECRVTDPAPGFSVYAMWNLGDIAQLPDLGPPPEPDSRYRLWRLWGE